MDTLDLQSVSTEDVMLRYGIKSRTTLNKFLENAGVNSFKEGRKTFIRMYQLGVLDRSAHELNYPINQSSNQSIQSIHPTDSIKSEQMELAESTGLFPLTTVDLLYITCEYENLPRLAKWLAGYAFLEKMSSGRVILPRDVVLKILDYKRLPTCKDGYFRYGNFVFLMIGDHKKEWLVSKK
ncbi:hypothetical protein [Nostoc punctiforme]|uniref:Uncharacterized protein n=2 Tax=Nostoc punctiforme TaxID=272131 RepID=B2ITF3_NOSP7|nr:hypothetical protein [Nostoc punctiforme]ACC81184.1 hypothetical protein Npun_R2630 [Nostoc punctiforme PCC 73102]RCJ40811.1 hypothetical protein A6769_39475 [Nostoc punctiforme NIES-2108]